MLVLALAMALVGCSSGVTPTVVDGAPGIIAAEQPASPPTTRAPATTTTTTPEIPYQFHGQLETSATMVTLLTENVDVFTSPGDEMPMMTQSGSTWFGANQVLTLVDEPVDGWAEVLLPSRPNSRTGWVMTDDLHFYVVGSRIVIDLGARTLVYYVDGEEVLRAPVAIGSPRNPTPTGSFFVTDSIKVPRGAGPFGPYALALSARSNTITEFNGGDGIIGIHGTNRPGLIGDAVSLGCIRLRNDVMTKLWELVPIGTPVDIH